MVEIPEFYRCLAGLEPFEVYKDEMAYESYLQMFLDLTDKRVLQHQRELLLGVDLTLQEYQFIELEQLRQACAEAL